MDQKTKERLKMIAQNLRDLAEQVERASDERLPLEDLDQIARREVEPTAQSLKEIAYNAKRGVRS